MKYGNNFISWCVWLLVACVLLVGCDTRWRDAPFTHTCTADQMTIVEKQTAYCKTNTGFNGEFCYGSAIMRNCERKK